MLVGTLRAAEAELGREREAKQRFEGELAAAQAIQMGLLPRRFPAFPDRRDIDIYARIEPARMVGGDLYDYLLIDGSSRLFFLIADVSGKGPPAALLMASTKEVVREAVLGIRRRARPAFRRGQPQDRQRQRRLAERGRRVRDRFCRNSRPRLGRDRLCQRRPRIRPSCSAGQGLAAAGDRRRPAARRGRGFPLIRSIATGSSRARFCCSTPTG